MKYHIRANGTPLCSWLKTVSHEKEEFHRQLESLDSEAIYGVVIQLENTWPDCYVPHKSRPFISTWIG